MGRKMKSSNLCTETSGKGLPEAERSGRQRSLVKRGKKVKRANDSGKRIDFVRKGSLHHGSSELHEKPGQEVGENDGMRSASEEVYLKEEPASSTTHPGGWRLCRNFAIRPPVSLPFLTGCIIGDSVLIRDLWAEELFLTNLTSGRTEQVYIDQLKGDVFHCALLDSDRMVYCDSKSGLVHICTTSGDHVKTIAITHRPSTHMYHVTVDRQGRVVYGVRDGKIFIIDPHDGKILSSFSVDRKIESITVTSSGLIVIKSGIAKFNVIEDGLIVQSLSYPDWSWAACVAHPTEDIIYMAYTTRDDTGRRRVRALHPKSADVLEEGTLVLQESPHPVLQPSMIITKDGNIVLCDNGKVLLLEKSEDRVKQGEYK